MISKLSKINIFTRTTVAAFAITAFSIPNAVAQAQKPAWPEITQQNKPWSRWWWEGSAVNPADLTWIMGEYQKVGLGGLEITPIYGVKGAESQFISFLSPKWMDMLQFTLKEAAKLNMGIDMAQASGWPFGGPWVSDEDASKYVTHKTYSLNAGEKLTEKIAYMQRPLMRIVGERIDISKLKDPITANPNLQLHAFDQVRFEKPLPLQSLMAYSDKGEILELTSKVNADGMLDWTAPKGKWTLYAVFEGWHGKMVERAGPGGEGYAIDHFSHDATVNYLSHFDKAFKGHDISPIRAFFNDSYEVDDAQGEANWTPRFFEEFKARRGYDLKNYLPALFAEEKTDIGKRVLCDYRETISDLLLENYTKTWHEWAHKHGALIRNQAHGSPANILDLYAATDIPEIEGTEMSRIKFASSAANVTGKPLISSESATWENDHFLSKLSDVKKAIDRFLLGGVNHVFYHGTNYTPKDAAWPGWLFYAAVHFTPNNPFWTDFGKLNNYIAHTQSFLQKGNPDNDILLYLPVYDSFSKPGRSLLQHFDGIEKGFKGTVLERNVEELLKKGYSFDYISDVQLIQTRSEGKKIASGKTSYQTVFVPAPQYLPLETMKTLVRLAENGAVIVFYKDIPADVPGLHQLEQRQAEFKNLLSKMNFTNAGNGIRKAVVGRGAFVTGDNLEELLKAAGVERETLVDQGLQYVRRSTDKGKYYFIANHSTKAVDGWIPLQAGASAAALYNPMTGQTGYAAIRKENGNANIYLQLEPGESCIVETLPESAAASYPYRKAAGAAQQISGSWTVDFISGGPKLPKQIKTDQLKSWTEFEEEGVKDFSGTARYTISFKKPKGKAEAWLLNLGDVQESANIKLNGQAVGTVLGPVYQLEIPASLLKKKNTLEINVSNSMANRIMYMDRNNIPWKIFYNTNMPAYLAENRGADGLFTTAKWQIKPSGLIGPVTLQGVNHFQPAE